jgi:hypothetical protein
MNGSGDFSILNRKAKAFDEIERGLNCYGGSIWLVPGGRNADDILIRVPLDNDPDCVTETVGFDLLKAIESALNRDCEGTTR